MARALRLPLSGFAARVGSSLRYREMTLAEKKQNSLTFEFLAPFYILAATTMAIATVTSFARSRNPIFATLLLGNTLIFVLNAFAASQAVKRMRESIRRG